MIPSIDILFFELDLLISLLILLLLPLLLLILLLELFILTILLFVLFIFTICFIGVKAFIVSCFPFEVLTIVEGLVDIF